MNIFEKATRQKLRFSSAVGVLDIQEVWDLPLIAKRSGAADLDSVAKEVNNELKSVSEESFVASTANPKKAELELKLEIVKHIIEVKLKEQEEAKAARAKAEEKLQLLNALHHKKEEQMASMTIEQIEARIKELS